VIADLEKNSASGLIFEGPVLTFEQAIDLDYPSGSVFNSESELLLCYDGQQQNGDCAVHYLDIIFDARGGGNDLRDLLYGTHRRLCFYHLLK